MMDFVLSQSVAARPSFPSSDFVSQRSSLLLRCNRNGSGIISAQTRPGLRIRSTWQEEEEATQHIPEEAHVHERVWIHECGGRDGFRAPQASRQGSLLSETESCEWPYLCVAVLHNTM